MSDNIDRVETEFVAKVDTALAAINKLIRASYGGSAEIKKNFETAEGALNRMFAKPNIEKGVVKSLDSVRTSLLSAGAGIPVLGVALGSLGTAGLVAAAGLGAYALTMGQAQKAVDFGAEIAKLSKTLGVSTDFLQKFSFAAHQSDIDVGVANESLKGLNMTLGLVQSGLARSMQTKAFAALGFTPAQLRSYHDAGELFPVLAERISKLGNAAEEAAIAQRLKIPELLPMLREGAAGFNSLAAEADHLGIVMDASLIKRAAEAKEKLNEISDVMKAKANISFIEFADTLILVKQKFLEAELAGLHMLGALTNTLSPRQRLQDDAKALQQISASYASHAKYGTPLSEQDLHLAGFIGDVAVQKKAIGTEAAANAAASAEMRGGSSADRAAQQLATPKAKKTPQDKSQAAIDAAMVAELAAHVSLLQELLSQAATLAEQNALADKITQTELDKVKEEQKKKDQAATDAVKAKTITADAERQIKAADKAAAADEAATIVAKAALATRERELAAREKILKQADELASLEVGTLSTMAGIAATLDEKRRLDAEALTIQQAQEVKDKALEYDKAIVAHTATEADKASGLTALAGSHAAAVAALGVQNADPVDTYLHSIKDLNTEIQNDGVQAFQSLSDSLGQSAAQALGLKGALGQFFASLISQLVQFEAGNAAGGIIKSIAGAFAPAAAVPGFAGGTNFAPGGVADVGEYGRERIILPRGAQVIPNNMLPSIQRMQSPGGGAMVLQTLHFHAEGAVITQDLLNQVNTMASQSATRAGITAYAQARKDIPIDMARRAGRRLG